MISLFKKHALLRGARFLFFVPVFAIIASCSDDDSNNSPTDNRSLFSSFVTTWKTDNDGAGTDQQVVIHTESQYHSYNYNVNWGDNSSDSKLSGDITHTYDEAGTYTVTISGIFPKISFGNKGGNKKLLSVEQWGDQVWQSMYDAFAYCPNLQINATDTPNLSQVTDMSWMFDGASAFNQDISDWDVSAATSMEGMFYGASSFNQDISTWDVSAVTSMKGMFYDASAFNQDISTWDVSAVTDMSYMFDGASSFNQNISDWEISSNLNTDWMFDDSGLSNDDARRIMYAWGL